MTEITTIHHQRRWFYVLWGVLLAAALVAWALWLIPGHRGVGTLTLRLRMAGAPAGMVAQVWTGPASSWKEGEQAFGSEVRVGKDGWLSFAPLRIPIVRRRWWKLLHPATVNQAVLRLSAPGEKSKFVFLDLNGDLNRGFLREDRTLGYAFEFDWNAITGADGSPTRIF